MSLSKLKFFFKKNNNFLKQLSSSYASFFVNVAITLWQTPRLLEYLGEELYGIWLLNNTITAFASLSSLGYIATMVNEFSKKKEDEIPALINNVFFSITISFLAACPLYFVVVWFSDTLFNVSEKNIGVLKNVLTINFLYHLTSYYLGFLLSIIFWLKREIIFKSIIEMVLVIATSAGYYILMENNIQFSYFYWIQAITFGTCLVIILFYLKNTLFISWRDFEWHFFTEKFKISFNYFLLGFSSVFALWGDSLFISSLADVKSLPSYNISFRLSDYSIKIIKKVVDTKAPELIHLKREGKFDKFISINNKVFYLAAILSLGSIFAIYFLGESVLSLWLKNMLSFDKKILFIFAVYIFFATTQYVNWTALSLLGKHKNLSYIVMIEVVVNIILSTVLYHFMGMYGISLGTLLSLILCSWWYSFYKARKEFKKLV